MKIFLFALIGAAMFANVGAVSAQDFTKGQFSVRAGLNVASGSYKSGGYKISLDSKIGFHAGIAYEMPISKTLPLFAETGLYGSSKGGKVDIGDGEVDNYSLFYLQLPVMVGYKFAIADNIALKPAAGLYFSYGVSGKAKSTYFDDDDKIKTKSYDVFKNDEDGVQEMKPFDMGLRIGVGADINTKYYVGLGYEIGLANVSGYNDGTTAKINCFTVSVGYNF